MDMLLAILPFVVMMIVTGAVAGILAGLLGVGGGIVIVPVLDFALGVYGVDNSIRLHIAVATSLACIILTSISSTKAHHAKGAVDFNLIKVWGPAILVGAFLGAIAASYVESQVLSLLFATVALMVAIKMTLPLDHISLTNDLPKGFTAPIAPFVIGGLSSMIGIGGGTLSVPTLTLMNQPIHRAVGTAALFGLFISLPGAIGFIISGIGDPRLPLGNFGYVNLIGFALISPMTVLMAPLGAKIAHNLNKRQLSLIFGSFLFIVATRMIYRTL